MPPQFLQKGTNYQSMFKAHRAIQQTHAASVGNSQYLVQGTSSSGMSSFARISSNSALVKRLVGYSIYMYAYIYIYNAANAAKQKTFVEKLPVNVLVSWIRDHQTPKPQKFHEVMLYQQGCGDELFFLIGSFRPAPLEHQIALHFRTPTTRLVQRPQPFTLKIVPHVARNVKKSHLS